ncbi:MAG: hypothetical protein NUW12_04805 [Firmicutes bacterium]|jgi:hypothetical protein|nr:hypothetical protein [Bacillota bacterium]MDH7495268.1 hypothetical protein [Bacillota bacterium]
MSTDVEAEAKTGGAARANDTPFLSHGEARRKTRAAAAGFRLPSFFLLVTLRLPGWRRALPVVFPLFVLEDVLESAGWLASVFSHLWFARLPRARGNTDGEAGLPGRGSAGTSVLPDPWGARMKRMKERTHALGCRPGREERSSIEFSVDWEPSWFFLAANVIRALRLEGGFTLVEVAEGTSGTQIAVRLV